MVECVRASNGRVLVCTDVTVHIYRGESLSERILARLKRSFRDLSIRRSLAPAL